MTFGDHTLSRLGDLCRAAGMSRVLLVTDPGIVEAGHIRPALAALAEAGLKAAVFDGVGENPTTEHVAAGVDAARQLGADGLVGLGGGSSMDCAKGVNFLLTQGGSMADYWGDGKARRTMLPAIGVPTTAGTGSEAQRFALISDVETHRKMACGDRRARFHSVILDPRLLTSLPRSVAAVTAMDALSHAVESYVTRRRNPISQLFAREAWRLLERSFERFLADPEDPASADMLLGAHLAGAAIETSMLGAAHSCANPLTARYGVTHGVAVGLMLPPVVRFNGNEVEPLYRELATTASLNGDLGNGSSGGASALRVSRRVSELRAVAGLPGRLEDCGVERPRLRELAEAAAKEWTASFNPRAVGADELESIYVDAF